ncbi:MAG: hypothetical protein AB7O57_08315 [Hyphomicrobiaceae bacterium]
MHPLKKWRIGQELTQEELGIRLGKSLYDIHRIEAAKQKSIGLRDALAIVKETGGAVTLKQLAEAHPG